MKKRLAIVMTGAALAAMAIVVNGWCLVAPGEVVVVRRFGRLAGPPWGPGLHWRLPLGLDRIERVRSDVVRQVTVGRASLAGADTEPAAGELMTGDLNLLRFQATVQYRIVSPVDYTLAIDQVEPLLATAAQASITRALATRRVDAALRSERQTFVPEVERELQGLANRYQSGISILSVSLTDVRPPTEVAADFAAAQSAESERDRRLNEARSHAETTQANANATAQATLEFANAAAQRTLLITQAEAQRFALLQAEAARSRSLTMRRLYVETMQELLAGVKRKVILPPGADVDLTMLGIQPEQTTQKTERSLPDASPVGANQASP
jgi:membrane protease subunit HflK